MVRNNGAGQINQYFTMIARNAICPPRAFYAASNFEIPTSSRFPAHPAAPLMESKDRTTVSRMSMEKSIARMRERIGTINRCDKNMGMPADLTLWCRNPAFQGRIRGAPLKCISSLLTLT
jgi:hypothetical protein